MAHRAALRRIGTGVALAVPALTLLPLVSAAILVSPHAVFIDARSRSAVVNLVNTGTEAEEVTIDLRYGYPVTDSAGQISVRLFPLDSIPEGEPAATTWIRAFPARVIVRGGDRQVVRLLAQPPPGLPDGEYWTRMIVTSRGTQLHVAGGDSSVRAGVSLIVSTVISVTYRTGTLRTAAQLTDFRVEATRDSLIAWVGLQRDGNAAYLGTTWIRVRDAAGRVVREWDTPTAVYFSLHRRFVFALDSLAPGRYTAELELTTRRDDGVPSLAAEPIVRTVGVDVP